ncbi:hypothetical protein [Paenibacillus aestuarii]|uniref:Uncharacterized protein n=1 Tax=Paenibacillus aestuarii TaxID=516965 RepID=A0ABW0K6H1_9BACL|nr:hypothetical protein [Paenibacillus aestuarii]
MNFHIDWNEWFVVICSVIAMTMFFRIRKHFNAITIVIIWIFNVVYVATLDYALAVTPFQLYYCGDNETYEPITAFAHIFMYPPFSFLFLYLYDKWNLRNKKNRKRLVFFFIGAAVFSVFFEWLNVLNGFLVYTGWKLYGSFPMYVFSALILLKLYHFIERNSPMQKKA